MVLQIPRMAVRLFSTTPEKVVEISRAAQFVVRLFSTTPEKVVEISRGSNSFERGLSTLLKSGEPWT